MIEPFVTTFLDYHDVDELERHFKNAGIKIKSYEIDCFHSDLCEHEYAEYHFVMYTGRKADVKVQSLIKKYNSIFEAQDD